MDKIVVCPECGAQMTLQDGQVVFSCVDCGTRLYCIKGVVITKSQAKILLKKLVEKKQAEKARQLEIERISAKNVNETVRPEPPMPMQPVAPVQVKMPEPEQKSILRRPLRLHPNLLKTRPETRRKGGSGTNRKGQSHRKIGYGVCDFHIRIFHGVYVCVVLSAAQNVVVVRQRVAERRKRRTA